LDASDASFVDILHTNQGGAGFLGIMGHVDHYANGAAPIQIQPQCRADLTESKLKLKTVHKLNIV